MIRAILTDIEGTTSSISFVHEVLFPYAAKHMAEFVRARQQAPEVRAQLDEVAKLSGKEAGDTEALIQQLLDWIKADQKITPLKALQGMIWEQGYARGDYQGHVYEDAAQLLKSWAEQGIDLYVYSSGSVQAQKLIFGYTAYGDLTPLFKGYFDTRIGGKREAESYRRILAEIDVAANEVLFLSDIPEELQAAQAAGYSVCWLVRGQAKPEKAAYPVASNFAEISLN